MQSKYEKGTEKIRREQPVVQFGGEVTSNLYNQPIVTKHIPSISLTFIRNVSSGKQTDRLSLCLYLPNLLLSNSSPSIIKQHTIISHKIVCNVHSYVYEPDNTSFDIDVFTAYSKQ